jgi:hypothetical protein
MKEGILPFLEVPDSRGEEVISMKKQLQKAMAFFRKQFKGQAMVNATLALTLTEVNLFPCLTRFEFVQVNRVNRKLRVEFI